MPRPSNPDLSDDLLSAALSLLEVRGDTQFSMKELAAEVGYTVTAIYRCFANKSHLLQAMQRKLFQELPKLFYPVLSHSSGLQQIQAIGSIFIRWALEHPVHYQFMFHSTEPATLLKVEDQEMARVGLRLLEQLIQAGVKRGEFEVEDPAVASIMLFSTLHGLLSLHFTQRLDTHQVSDPLAFYEMYASQWIERLLTLTRADQ